PQHLHDFLHADGWFFVPVVNIARPQICLQKLENRIRKIRKISSYLTENIDCRQPNFELRMLSCPMARLNSSVTCARRASSACAFADLACSAAGDSWRHANKAPTMAANVRATLRTISDSATQLLISPRLSPPL